MEIDCHHMSEDGGDVVCLDRCSTVVPAEGCDGCTRPGLVQTMILDSPNVSSDGTA
jgi:hypothetical protein